MWILFPPGASVLICSAGVSSSNSASAKGSVCETQWKRETGSVHQSSQLDGTSTLAPVDPNAAPFMARTREGRARGRVMTLLALASTSPAGPLAPPPPRGPCRTTKLVLNKQLSPPPQEPSTSNRKGRRTSRTEVERLSRRLLLGEGSVCCPIRPAFPKQDAHPSRKPSPRGEIVGRSRQRREMSRFSCCSSLSGAEALPARRDAGGGGEKRLTVHFGRDLGGGHKTLFGG